MGGAKRYPSNGVDASMGFAKGSTHPTSCSMWREPSKRVGWVERSDTHQMVLMPRWVSQRAQPILRTEAGSPARSVADGKAGSDAVEQVRRRRPARRMGGAKRYPSNDVHASMGFAKGSTHPTSCSMWREPSKRVGWVERSDTHQMMFMPRWVSQRAQPILRTMQANPFIKTKSPRPCRGFFATSSKMLAARGGRRTLR
jgi:hypothetical protein